MDLALGMGRRKRLFSQMFQDAAHWRCVTQQHSGRRRFEKGIVNATPEVMRGKAPAFFCV